jgi:hypothetical protein
MGTCDASRIPNTIMTPHKSVKALPMNTTIAEKTTPPDRAIRGTSRETQTFISHSSGEMHNTGHCDALWL